jgi:exodeoxyribonuclease VII large subunit
MANQHLSPSFDEHFAVAPVEPVYTVSQYIALLNRALRPLRATIQGEIGKIRYSAKAVYFNLCDATGSVITCLVWQNVLQGSGVELRDGMEVKLQGYPDIYPLRGDLTFKMDTIIPVGEGALKLAFERLKRKLAAAGYFRQERKQKLPRFVSKIGLITSQHGVVIRDFLEGLGSRGLSIAFYDVRVEGLSAVEQITDAIRFFNRETDTVQVLVIARGGGA